MQWIFTLRMNGHSVMLSARRRSSFPAVVWGAVLR
jgi:hypothetical protein